MSGSRCVRVFLSSTFRDFATERDLLVRKVFPELRRRARERDVEVIDVDLRWGITANQAERGEVLPICLAEIDRARPYFIGLLGERYGWVPEAYQYAPSLLIEQPWLDDLRGEKSVTELEILYGVLNNPAMAGRAFFYFRDRAFCAANGDFYLSESETHREKLESLKAKIRESGFPVIDGYPNPEALAAHVQEDLWRVIDQSFPIETAPDPRTSDNRKHQLYGSTRLGLYVGGSRNLDALDEALQLEPSKPVLITGESGSGKTALIANWEERYKKSNPDDYLVTHYLGSSADAADAARILRRIAGEIARHTGEEDKLTKSAQNIIHQFPRWLDRASDFAKEQGRTWILLLDGLEELPDNEKFQWLPSELPHRIKLVLSCADGEIQAKLKARIEVSELTVPPLKPEDGFELIQLYLARFKKTLPEAESTAILAHPLAGSPLFLRTVAEELRVFGIHESLKNHLARYLKCTSMEQLFATVLSRVEEDNQIADLEAALSVLWGSLESFAENELLSVSGLAPAIWSSILNALDGSLISSGGRVQFAHNHIRIAAEARYVSGREQKVAVKQRLAMFCAEQMRSVGRGETSSYVRRHAIRHFMMVQQWDEAFSALSDLEYIEARAKAKELAAMREDYARLISLLPEMRARFKEKRKWESTMRRWSAELQQYATDSTKRRAEGYAMGSPPCPPGAIKFDRRDQFTVKLTPDSQEEVDAKQEQFLKNCNRVDTLEGFLRFISTQGHLLETCAKQPGFIAQHAYNFEKLGAVQFAGAKLLPNQTHPLLLRRWFPVDDGGHPPHPCRLTITARSIMVNAVSISADASMAVSSGHDSNLKVWDLVSGNCALELKGHSDFVTASKLSLSAAIAVSGSTDKTVRIWDLSSGRCLQVMQGHSNPVSCVDISADASLAISGSYDGTLRVWDVATGESKRILEGHSDWVSCLAVSADTSFAISGSWDCSLRVWDLATGDSMRVLEGHLAIVSSVSVSTDGKVAVSGSWDKTIRVWDVSSGNCTRILKGHVSPVTAIALSSDGTVAVSGSLDKTIRVWSLNSGRCVRTLTGCSDAVNCLTITPDAAFALSASADAYLRLWQLEFATSCQTYSERVNYKNATLTTSVAISSDGASAISACGNSLQVWNLKCGSLGFARGFFGHRKVRSLNGHSSLVTSVAISPTGYMAVSGSLDGTARLWDLTTGSCSSVLMGHSAKVKAVAISPNGSTAISASTDHTLRLWDTASGDCIRVLSGHSDEVTSVAISEDGLFAVSGSKDSSLRIWDLATGESLRTLHGHTNAVTAVAISHDCNFAVSASSHEGTLRVWNVLSGECFRLMKAPSLTQGAIAISADDRLILAACLNQQLTVWDVESGTSIAVLGLNDRKPRLALHGNTLVVANSSGSIESYRLTNFPILPLITTPSCTQPDPANRSRSPFSARPACCGQFIEFPDPIICRIRTLLASKEAIESPDASLNLDCPHCGTALRVNPFLRGPAPI